MSDTLPIWIRVAVGDRVNAAMRTQEPLREVCGIPFYEHPFLGDEAALITRRDGTFYHTEFYDIPTAAELECAS